MQPIPPIPDDFKSSDFRYTAIPGHTPRAFRVESLREDHRWETIYFEPRDSWRIEAAWARCLGDKLLTERKAEGSLVGRPVVFTPEVILRGKPDASYSGISFYFNKAWQRFDDDSRGGKAEVLVCSALADGGAYLEYIDDGRSYFFFVPDAHIRFVDLTQEEVVHLRREWLAARAAEPAMAFIARTQVREDGTIQASPYDLRKVVLRAGDEVKISNRYSSECFYPGTGRGGTKHFDVQLGSGEVLRCVDGTPLAVNMSWDEPDLPYGGPTIVDECRVRF